MKHDAISTHERSQMIAILATRGKWHAERLGATISMARLKTQDGGEIQYAVTMGQAHVTTGRCKTVAEAVEDVNQIIRGRPAEPMQGRKPDPERTGQAQLIRQRTKVESQIGTLWE